MGLQGIEMENKLAVNIKYQKNGDTTKRTRSGGIKENEGGKDIRKPRSGRQKKIEVKKATRKNLVKYEKFKANHKTMKRRRLTINVDMEKKLPIDVKYQTDADST